MSPREGERGLRVVTQGLRKEYAGGVEAIRGIDLHADTGEIVALLGPNGAGKSTTLNILATLIRSSGGSAEICGTPIQRVRDVRRKIGVALQEAGLDPVMTAADHFEVQGALYARSRTEAKERGAALLTRFGLDSVADTPIGRYSGGMQRRLALALALLGDPPVIILDEPTAGLDPTNRRVVWEQLKELRELGTTVLFSTHYLDEAQELSDRLYLIFDGEIVRSGAPGMVRDVDRAAARQVSFTVGALPEQVVRILSDMGLSGIQDIEASGGRATTIGILSDGDGVELTERILERMREEGVDVHEVHVGAPSLEDVFLALDGCRPQPETFNGNGLEAAARRVRGGRRWQ